MPFGLQGAPATIQRLMDRVLRGLDEFAAAYLDDVVVFSSIWEEHLQKVMQRLRDAGLTVKLKKYQFGMDHCVYLGHVVRSGEVAPEPTKPATVKTFPVPRTKKQVRVFLGLAGYYRCFIPDYASIEAPLTDLMKKSGSTYVMWTTACVNAFQKLKG